MKFSFKIKHVRQSRFRFMPKIYFYYGNEGDEESYLIKAWNILPSVYIAKGENSKVHLLLGNTTDLEKLAKACNVPDGKKLERLNVYRRIWQMAYEPTFSQKVALDGNKDKEN